MLNRRGFMLGVTASVGAMTVMSEIVTAQEQATSLIVIYPNHEGAKFDLSYYRSTHIPLAMKVMKAERVMLIAGVAMGSTAAPYAMICHFQFASPEALNTGRAAPGMAEVRADIPKFTDIKPTVMVGKSY